MLSEQEIAEIEQEVRILPQRRAGCIEGLKVLQKHRGWVDDDAVADLADLLGMTPDEVDSVATFYNLVFRRPVGRHVILLCDSVSCWIRGYEDVRDALREHLSVDFGQTTGDDRFTLLPMVCLGDCDHAPAMMVDEDLHRHVEPAKVGEILEGYE
ncbi:MAG: NADH-quinone oxidoreductase subunit NuoE [Myxococcota bacterium]